MMINTVTISIKDYNLFKALESKRKIVSKDLYHCEDVYLTDEQIFIEKEIEDKKQWYKECIGLRRENEILRSMSVLKFILMKLKNN